MTRSEPDGRITNIKGTVNVDTLTPLMPHRITIEIADLESWVKESTVGELEV